MLHANANVIDMIARMLSNERAASACQSEFRQDGGAEKQRGGFSDKQRWRNEAMMKDGGK